MKSTKARYVTAGEIMEELGMSRAKAYQLIKQLNAELKEKGFITVRGKVSRKYFEERCCYGSAE